MFVGLKAAIAVISNTLWKYTPALLVCSSHLSATARDAFRLIVSLGDKLMEEKHTLLECPLKMQCFHFSKQLLPFGGSFIKGMS